MTTWRGRIRGETSPLFEAFTSSVQQDRVLADYDTRASQAHTRELAKLGLISEEEAVQLIGALDDIAREIRAGELAWRDELEDVHTHVEASLREKLGLLASALHAGRSRNDQIAADLRMYVVDQTRSIMTSVLELQSALIDLGRKYADAVMPGYTHLQQAQPVVIAFPLLAYVSMLSRDWERFQESLSRSDRSPLGSGALAGSSFPLDREALARNAGLGTPIDNAMDAVSDRDFIIEFVNAAALCMVHLSRVAEDLIIWASVEFQYVRLPDAFASGSSMMPQKKNPDVLELIRGKTGLVVGDAMALLTLMKGLPLSYDRDLQEDKRPLFEAAETLTSSLRVLAAMIAEVEFDTKRCEEAVSSFAMATDLADFLVLQGMPFRQAHSVVATLVARRLDAGQPFSHLAVDEVREAGADVTQVPVLTPQSSVRAKATSGSTNPDDVRSQLNRQRAVIDQRKELMGRGS